MDNEPTDLENAWLEACALAEGGDHEAAANVMQTTIEQQALRSAAEPLELRSAKGRLAIMLSRARRHDEAAAVWQQVAELGSSDPAASHGSKHFALGAVVTELSKAARHAEAIKLGLELLEMELAAFGPKSHVVAWTKTKVAWAMANAGRHVEAATWRHEVVVAFTSIYGADDPKTTSAANWLADARRAAGLGAEAD